MGLIPHNFQHLQVTMGGALLNPYLPLGLAGLEEYYDARTLLGTLAHGASVHTWPDLSGHTRTMTDTGTPSAPTYLATSSLSPKGQPLVRWSGIDNCLGSGSINPMPLFTLGYSMHSAGLWQATAAPPAPFPGGILWQTDLGQPQLIRQTNGTNLTAFRDNVAIKSVCPQASTLGWHLLSFVFDPPDAVGTCRFYIDGVLTSSSNVWDFNYFASQSTLLGNTPAFNLPLKGDMGYFFWCSRAHTTAEVALIALWSSIFWG